MTPTILIELFAILAGGACFIAFLTVILILVYKLLSPQEFYEEQSKEENVNGSGLNKEEFAIYTNGIMRGSSIVFVSLFKVWKDNQEVPLVGDFDEFRVSIGKNLDTFNKDKKIMDEWIDKYNEHFKKAEDDK